MAVTLEQARRLRVCPKCFYVYVLRDPRDKSLFYVGCTRRPVERFSQTQTYSARVRERIHDIRLAGQEPEREILGLFGSAKIAGLQERHAVEALRAKGIDVLNHLWGGFYGRVRARRPPRVTRWDVPGECA